MEHNCPVKERILQTVHYQGSSSGQLDRQINVNELKYVRVFQKTKTTHVAGSGEETEA